MINIKNFSILKAKSAVNLIKAGDTYAISYKKFDSNTGEVLPSEVFEVNMEEIDEKIISLQAELNELKAFKTACLAIV